MTNQLKVWWKNNLLKDALEIPVRTPDEAVTVINALADLELAMGDVTVWNACGLIEFIDGEWTEWESADGDDIRQYEEWLEETSAPAGADTTTGDAGGDTDALDKNLSSLEDMSQMLSDYQDENRALFNRIANEQSAELDNLRAQLAAERQRAERAEALVMTLQGHFGAISDYAFAPDKSTVNAADMTVRERLDGAGGQAEAALGTIADGLTSATPDGN